jgi:hypothetical protein
MEKKPFMSFLFSPDWPLHAAKVLHEDVLWPNQYLRAN